MALLGTEIVIIAWTQGKVFSQKQGCEYLLIEAMMPPRTILPVNTGYPVQLFEKG
jgi:hypothetical protein